MSIRKNFNDLILECDNALLYIINNCDNENGYILAHKDGVESVKRFALSANKHPFNAEDLTKIEQMFETYDSKQFPNVNMQQFDIVGSYMLDFVDYARGEEMDVATIAHKLTNTED